MIMNVISSEIYKIFKNKFFYGTLIVFLVMNVIAFVSGFKEKLSSGSSEMLGTGISTYQASYEADGIIYIILIFVAFSITAEYANGSIRQMASHGIERWRLVLGQYIAISLVITIVVLGFGFINLLSFTILSGLGEIDITVFMRMNLGMLCIIWASTGVGTFLSHLLKNVGITIIASIVLAVGSNFIVNIFALLTNNDTFLMYGLSNMRKIIINFVSKPEDIMKCCLVLVLIGVTAILGSCILFSKRDVE